VRFPFLEEQGYCQRNAPCEQVCVAEPVGPSPVDLLPVAPLPGACAPAGGCFGGYPADWEGSIEGEPRVRSAAFAEMLPPTQFVPVPTSPVFGP
jgi:hypothetical protein